MVSKSSDSASKIRASDAFGTLTYKIHQLKKQIQADRVVSIRKKLEENGKKLEGYVSKLVSVSTSRNAILVTDNTGLAKMLSSRIENPLCKFGGLVQGSGDKDYANIQEVVSSPCAKIPYVEKIPPYTTWIFLERNQRMAEDQSVVGRRRIYYDPHGSEALICSDSEEENAEPEEEKHEYSEVEDRILWMAFQEYELSEEVLNIVSQFIGGTTSEIQERYNILKEKNHEKQNKNFKGSGEIGSERSFFLDKSLSAASDSFDNLFCRRCLVFDCRLHGCSQNIINPSEKQCYSSESEEDVKPCGDQCYLHLRVVKDLKEDLDNSSTHMIESKTSEPEGRIPVSPDAGEPVPHSESTGKRKVSNHTIAMPEDSTLISDDVQGSSAKKQKKLSDLNAVTVSNESDLALDCSSNTKIKELDFGASHKNEFRMTTSEHEIGDTSRDEMEGISRIERRKINTRKGWLDEILQTGSRS